MAFNLDICLGIKLEIQKQDKFLFKSCEAFVYISILNQNKPFFCLLILDNFLPVVDDSTEPEANYSTFVLQEWLQNATHSHLPLSGMIIMVLSILDLGTF